MIIENLQTLKIHKLSQEQYNRELAAGNLDENALYLTPDEEIDLSPYATVEQLNGKANTEHSHDDTYYTETEVDSLLSGKANTSHTHTVANISDLTATATELNYMDGVTSNVQTQLNGKSESGHTHNYADSSSSGGAATSANKLTTARTISLTGDTTGSVSFDGSKDTSIATTTSNIVYTNISSAPTGSGSYPVNISTAFTINGITFPQYAKGMFVSTGTSDATLYVIDAEGNMYVAYRNNGTWQSAKKNYAIGAKGSVGEIFNNYVNNVASGSYSHAEGSGTTASGYISHAEGSSTTASGSYSHSEGSGTTAAGNYSHASGYSTIANDYQFVVGKSNKDTAGDTTTGAGIFIVGIGASNSARTNGFRVNPAGKVYGTGTFGTSGADYAEYFEWLDGNPKNEDRRGHFVTLEGDKIRYTTPNDDYILGVVSADPSVVGDIHSEDWHNRYLKDVFGSKIVDVVEVEEITNEDGKVIPAHTERRWVLNPDYNPDATYISREERPEWAAIGIVGKLVVVDDGTCQANGYCYPDADGIATASQEKTNYRVMERLDDTHIRIFIR